MTREEAIYQQEYLKEMHNASPEVMEACEMAIRSFEAWDKIKEEIINYGTTGQWIPINEVINIIDKFI